MPDPKNNRTPSRVLFEGMTCLVIVSLILFLASDLVLNLLTGWIGFIATVGPRIRWRWDGIVIFAGLFVFCVACTQYLFQWLAREVGSNRQRTIGWSLRSSLALVTMLLMLFVICISMAGVVHQVGWLIQSPESLYTQPTQSADDSDLSDYRPGIVIDDARTSTLEAIAPYHHYWIVRPNRAKSWNADENAAAYKNYYPEAICPSNQGAIRSPDGFGLSHLAGNKEVFKNRIKLAKVESKGQTICMGEVTAALVPWAHLDANRDVTNGIQHNWKNAHRGQVGFGSDHSGGASFMMLDASVLFLSNGTDPQILQQLGQLKRSDEDQEMTHP